jgi:hypothetical protein
MTMTALHRDKRHSPECNLDLSHPGAFLGTDLEWSNLEQWRHKRISLAKNTAFPSLL